MATLLLAAAEGLIGRSRTLQTHLGPQGGGQAGPAVWCLIEAFGQRELQSVAQLGNSSW